MTIADLRQKLKSGEVSSKELVQEKIERIKALDTTLNSFLTVNTDEALSQAEYVDKQIASGEPISCLLYTSPSPRDGLLSRMPSSA